MQMDNLKSCKSKNNDEIGNNEQIFKLNNKLIKQQLLNP